MNIGPDIVTEYTGYACDKYENAVYKNRFLSCPFEIINGGGQKVFKYGYYGTEACKGHEQEEK